MNTELHVGQKVLCLDDSDYLTDPCPLRYGVIYTIRQIFKPEEPCDGLTRNQEFGIRLKEVKVRFSKAKHNDWIFRVSRFVPIRDIQLEVTGPFVLQPPLLIG